MTIDQNLEGKELFEFLIKNKSVLIAEKKYKVKEADPVTLYGYAVNRNGDIIKSVQKVDEDPANLNATVVINTCWLMDSHKDVHVEGLWKKSLSENKLLYLLQEHNMSFKGIITDEVKAYTKKLTWKTLGWNIEGDTEALIFEANIPKNRNEFMFNEYKMGRVKNHSVGMRYVNIEMAINDEDYKEEFATWNKYIDKVANRAEAEKGGYFFPVKEAIAVEGSAVVKGSNWITPTLEVKEIKELQDTRKEPPVGTPDEPSLGFDIKQLLNTF